MVPRPPEVIQRFGLSKWKCCAAHNEMLLGPEHEASGAGITDAGMALV